ncbi:hypothetical protein [Bradyrhizobium sp. UNPA324]|uniref:O-antigen ligase family protein n=1 Tax=Bradyrhizobium sp. UNPA324 TaxID=1141174 RepID=UPI00114F6A69|nr:hypothetical protein [Bradyrhizobium sp. UNPA324]
MTRTRLEAIGAAAPYDWAPSDPREALAVSRHQFAAWFVLAGLIIPAWEAQVSIAGAKFTVGRLAVTLLVGPALVLLTRRGRHAVVCDLFAFLTAAWMLGAAASTAGFGSLSSPAAESLQFLFSYIVARGYFFSPAALDTFVRALKILTVAVVLVGAVEYVSGRWIAHEAAAAIFGTTPLGAVTRSGVIRATSTLDHPILFGVFCALVNPIVLLSERAVGRKILLSGVCLAGCVLSQSSAALMAYVLGVAAYSYDRLMRRLPGRWMIFWTVLGVAIGALITLAEHPIGWLISHLTLDPVTGYYRILIWDAAFERIGQSPLTGYSFQLFDENILDSTVDCVWLVEALRFGLPAMACLLATNLMAIWPVRRHSGLEFDDFCERMNLAFTMVILLFFFTGITVHFWNYIWIFWGLCIGIKASLREILCY